MTTQPRGAGILGGVRWLRGLAAVGTFALATTDALAQPPRPVAGPSAATPDVDRRVVAYVHANTPITREELGEFLIARGGMEKIELLANKKVIEIEAARRGITVTLIEVEAALNDDLAGSGVKLDDFAQFVRTKFGKTLYEWQFDIIRPRLLLNKMCRERVKIGEDEVRRLYENRYGEKRVAQVIALPKLSRENYQPPAPAARAAIRTDSQQFDHYTVTQPDAELAKAQGRTNPVGRFGDGADPKVETALFTLKVNEISEWIETPNSWLLIKLLSVIPPDANAPIEKVRGLLEKELFDRRLGEEVPKVIEELKKQANVALTQHVPVPPPVELPPGTPPLAAPVRIPEADPRVLARVYGQPVTRQELGEFLIARGGYEKLDVLVNKRVIEIEAARRGIAVTPQEVEAALAEELKGYPAGLDGTPVTKEVFATKILPLRKMSLYEYTEDVIKPRLTLHRLSRDRVKVTEQDLREGFENKFGEKRGAKIIIWPKEQFRQAQKQWDEARKGDAEFDRVARGQTDPNLASRAGEVLPSGRFMGADNPMIEQVLFGTKPGEGLREGEVSQLLDTQVGIMCVKCTKIYPPAGNVQLHVVRPALEKEVFEKKLAREVPILFGELRKQASPNILLKGPPTPSENAEGAQQLLNQVLSNPPAPPPPKK